MTGTTLDIPVVILTVNDNIKFLENLKQGFNITVSWYKYRSVMTIQPKNNKLIYMVDQTFKNLNMPFVFWFKYIGNDPSRNLYYYYCMWLIEIKDFNELLYDEPFFD